MWIYSNNKPILNLAVVAQKFNSSGTNLWTKLASKKYVLPLVALIHIFKSKKQLTKFKETCE